MGLSLILSVAMAEKMTESVPVESAPLVQGVESEANGAGNDVVRFEIKKWNAVTMWSWDICADTCAICRNSLNEPSIEYQVLQ